MHPNDKKQELALPGTCERQMIWESMLIDAYGLSECMGVVCIRGEAILTWLAKDGHARKSFFTILYLVSRRQVWCKGSSER